MARKIYKFFIDGTLVNDPLNWAEAKISLKRNETYKFVMFKYIGDLKWDGQAYDAIQTAIDTNGYCQTLPVIVQYSNDDGRSFNTLMDGFIFLKDIRVDEWKCQIECNIEESNYIERFLRIEDLKCDTTSTRALLVGAGAISQATKRTIIISDDNGTTGVARKGYYFFDLFQHWLDSMFGANEIIFTSTYLTTDSSRQITTITFPTTSQLSTGSGNIVITYTNSFGEQQTATAAIQLSASATLNRISYALRPNNSATTAKADYYQNDYVKIDYNENNGTNTVTIKSDYPITINSITGVTSSVTVTDEVDGMNRLSLFSGSMLRNFGNAAFPMYSFKQLFEELDKFRNVGLYFYVSNNQKYCRLENIEYFYSSTVSYNFQSVKGITTEISREYAADMIETEDNSNKDNYRGNISEPRRFISGFICADNSVDLKNNFIQNSDDINKIKYASDDKYDDELFILECEPEAVPSLLWDADARKYMNRQYTNTSGTYREYCVFNARLNNYGKARRWMFNVLGDLQYGSKTFYNETAIKLLKSAKFEYPISFTDLQTIYADLTESVTFCDNSNNYNLRHGFIFDIEYEIQTSRTMINLITT